MSEKEKQENEEEHLTVFDFIDWMFPASAPLQVQEDKQEKDEPDEERQVEPSSSQ